MLNYQNQDSTQTLEEGLAEFRDQIEGLVDESNVPEQSAKFFRAHDICHVIFGCSSSLEDEALADVWTMLAVDISVRVYMKFLKDPNVTNIFNDISISQTIIDACKSTPRMFKAWRASRKMTKTWPMWESDVFLKRSISEIRKEFNIIVI